MAAAPNGQSDGELPPAMRHATRSHAESADSGEAELEAAQSGKRRSRPRCPPALSLAIASIVALLWLLHAVYSAAPALASSWRSSPSSASACSARPSQVVQASRASSWSSPLVSSVGMCLAVKDQAEDLLEWVWWHAEVLRVERIYIFDSSNSSSAPLLQPFIDAGTVLYMQYAPSSRATKAMQHWPSGQRAAYDTCLWLFGDRHEWLVMIDTDEFLETRDMSQPLGATLRREYERDDIAALLPVWRLFGNHQRAFLTRPDGGTLRNFCDCVPVPYDYKKVAQSGVGKSIVRPSRVMGMANPHHPLLISGYTAVDENREPVAVPTRPGGPDLLRLSLPSRRTANKIWVNHFVSRSVAQNVAKMSRGVGEGVTKNERILSAIDRAAIQKCHSLSNIVKQRGICF